AAVTIAVVASLETLLNIQAVDKLDPQQRTSPPSRELLAQGAGNFVSGLIGGLPVTSVIVRSSVNVMAGAKTKLSAIIHGILLLVAVPLIPTWLNRIPLSSLAAILLVTGIKLASPALVRQMWHEGRSQFLPFMVTVVAIVLTDLLIGILIGLATAIGFILHSNVRHPIRRFIEKQPGGEVLHIELTNQVSFLNRAALAQALSEAPANGHVLIDAQNTDYIDPDVLSLIRDFKELSAPARHIEVSLVGFMARYQFEDQIQHSDYSNRELRKSLTPREVLQILKEGNERFRSSRPLARDLNRQIRVTADRQHPLAVVLSCIDSRTPAEIIFDLSMGDIFGICIAGNVVGPQILASAEYGCAVAGAKLILVVGHTSCGAVTTAVKLACSAETAAATGCDYLGSVVTDIQRSLDPTAWLNLRGGEQSQFDSVIDTVTRQNVQRAVESFRWRSRALDKLVCDQRIAIVGALYHVESGAIELLTEFPPEPTASSS
ncbi:MAG: SulP family inorganic anion transporter, partial [Nitrospira sp.]|nr:SulP family inorganic anion transporter [Nitrospira sp.]